VFVVAFGGGVGVEEPPSSTVINDAIPDDWLSPPSGEATRAQEAGQDQVQAVQQTPKRVEVRRNSRMFLQLAEPKRPGLKNVSGLLRAMFVLSAVVSVACFCAAGYFVFTLLLFPALVGIFAGVLFLLVSVVLLSGAELLDVLRGVEYGLFVLNENAMTAGESN
jgi:hypothetical protein